MANRRHFLTVASLASLGLHIPGALAAAGSLEAVKQRKALRFGVINQDPWFIKDPVSQQWQGVAVDIGRAMAKDLGVEFQPVETTWATAVAGLQSDRVDIQFMLEPTAARRQVIDFTSEPVFYYAMGALIQTNMADVKTWDDLDKPNYRIGVPLGSNLDALLTARMKQAKIERLQSTDEVVAAFAAKRIEIVAHYHPTLLVMYTRVRMGKLIVPEPVFRAQTYAGLGRTGDPALTNWVNAFLTKMHTSGEIDWSLERYMETRGVKPAVVKEFAVNAKKKD